MPICGTCVCISQHSVFFNITLLWTWTFLATVAKATKLKLKANKVPTGFTTKTVKSILTDISKFKGLSVDDDKQKNFLSIFAENLIKTLDNCLSKSSATDPDVPKMIDEEVRMMLFRRC